MSRGVTFHLLCALSLILAVVVGLWVGSFEGEFHHWSFCKGGERFTLRSKWGQVVMFGPPIHAEDEGGREVALRMRNGDFEWRAQRPGFVEGIARPGSASWEMYEKFRDWMSWHKAEVAPVRRWLAAMEDEERFLPAHLMMLEAAEEKRKSYFHLSYPWREGTFRTVPTFPPPEGAIVTPEMRVDPVLYFKVDASGNAPDVSLRQRLHEEWHDVLDTPRWAVFHGWVFLAAMILPVAWVARPRWGERKTTGWVFNWLALVSGIVCVVSVGMWVRSYWVDEQWTFAARASKSEVKWNYPMRALGWIGSSKGELVFRERDAPTAGWTVPTPLGVGYQRRLTRGYSLPVNLSVSTTGERKMKMPGIDLHVLPAQLIRVNVPATIYSYPAGIGFPAGTMAIPATTSSSLVGFRSLVISWWLIVAASAMVPVIWGWRAGIWWRRWIKQRLMRTQICLVCGYDMRATPGRCPECGSVRDADQKGESQINTDEHR